jgi:hypothetical protein
MLIKPTYIERKILNEIEYELTPKYKKNFLYEINDKIRHLFILIFSSSYALKKHDLKNKVISLNNYLNFAQYNGKKVNPLKNPIQNPLYLSIILIKDGYTLNKIQELNPEKVEQNSKKEVKPKIPSNDPIIPIQPLPDNEAESNNEVESNNEAESNNEVELVNDNIKSSIENLENLLRNSSSCNSASEGENIDSSEIKFEIEFHELKNESLLAGLDSDSNLDYFSTDENVFENGSFSAGWDSDSNFDYFSTEENAFDMDDPTDSQDKESNLDFSPIEELKTKQNNIIHENDFSKAEKLEIELKNSDTDIQDESPLDLDDFEVIEQIDTEVSYDQKEEIEELDKNDRAFLDYYPEDMKDSVSEMLSQMPKVKRADYIKRITELFILEKMRESILSAWDIEDEESKKFFDIWLRIMEPYQGKKLEIKSWKLLSETKDRKTNITSKVYEIDFLKVYAGKPQANPLKLFGDLKIPKTMKLEFTFYDKKKAITFSDAQIKNSLGYLKQIRIKEDKFDVNYGYGSANGLRTINITKDYQYIQNLLTTIIWSSN